MITCYRANTCQIEEGLDRINCIPMKSLRSIDVQRADNRDMQTVHVEPWRFAWLTKVSVVVRGGETRPGGTVAENRNECCCGCTQLQYVDVALRRRCICQSCVTSRNKRMHRNRVFNWQCLLVDTASTSDTTTWDSDLTRLSRNYSCVFVRPRPPPSSDPASLNNWIDQHSAGCFPMVDVIDGDLPKCSRREES